MVALAFRPIPRAFRASSVVTLTDVAATMRTASCPTTGSIARWRAPAGIHDFAARSKESRGWRAVARHDAERATWATSVKVTTLAASFRSIGSDSDCCRTQTLHPLPLRCVPRAAVTPSRPMPPKRWRRCHVATVRSRQQEPRQAVASADVQPTTGATARAAGSPATDEQRRQARAEPSQRTESSSTYHSQKPWKTTRLRPPAPGNPPRSHIHRHAANYLTGNSSSGLTRSASNGPRSRAICTTRRTRGGLRAAL